MLPRISVGHIEKPPFDGSDRTWVQTQSVFFEMREYWFLLAEA